MSRSAALLVAATVTAYWAAVLGGGLRRAIRDRGRSGLVPSIPAERLLFLAFVPVVAAWIALPWRIAFGPDLLPFPAGVRLSAAVGVVAGVAATVRCWSAMGREWSVAVLDTSSRLVTEGPFSLVRHPIYALGMAMVVLSAVALPTTAMAAVAGAHVLLLSAKARIEERALARRFGAEWTAYARRTPRFLPQGKAWRSTRGRRQDRPFLGRSRGV